MIDDSLVTPKQAAASLGISDQTVYRWIAAGLISATAQGLTKKSVISSRGVRLSACGKRGITAA